MIRPHESDMLGDLVSRDFRTAAIFDRLGIDFCCGGRRTLRQACETAGVPVETVIRDLGELPETTPAADDPRQWTIDCLVTHILTHHHAYVAGALPLISAYLRRLVEVHGARHPELCRCSLEFERLRTDLLQHMVKEERVLFPYLRDLEAAEHENRQVRSCPFGTVENPIRMMEQEHELAGDELRSIRELTGGYRTPDDGCATYRVAMLELQRFERDLYAHVHLENNVLFPKALAMERRVFEWN